MKQQIIGRKTEKFSIKPYTITENYLQEMYARMEDFRNSVRTNAELHLTLITSAGVADNEYSDSIQNIITLENLFRNN